VALFTRGKQGLQHRRIDAEIARCEEIREIKKNAGKQGASKRWNMAHAKAADSTCDSQTMANDSRARSDPRARTEPDPDAISPPFYPPGGGTRTGRHKNGVKGSEPRNGFTASILADMENTDAEQVDARPSGATVVPISRRVIGG
jgi:hypothetical protein